MSDIEKLLYLQGVAAEYHDYHGQRREVPWEDRLKVLEALAYDPGNERQIQQAVYALDAQPWLRWLQPMHIASIGTAEHIDIRLSAADVEQEFEYCISSAGEDIARGVFFPDQLTEVGEYYIGTTKYCAQRLPLTSLQPGYYQFELGSGEPRRHERTTLAVSPARCFDGNWQNEHSAPRKRWGISCQLYTLRSERNWGIGDFSDLRELIELSSAFGADIIGLNPLHAPDLHGEDYSSPYSPSHRGFLNPLYIDLEQVPDFAESAAIQSLAASRTFQHSLRRLRAAELVDYPAVVRIKFAMFDSLFQHFLDQHIERNSQRAIEFSEFVAKQGIALEHYAAFESSRAMSISAKGDQPRFHCYLQWLAAEQLAECQKLAVDSGMSIGLMGDLAVGAVKEGAEVAANSEIYCTAAEIGAPPDPFAAKGQNWNMPVTNPVAMRANAYAHFIELLRSNMSHYGALRIDHILGLMRLWWCLPGTRDGGTYVYYPIDDLMAIVRLESRLQQCVVIGEDLGVVPDDLRAHMAVSGVYANKVLYFETNHEQRFRPPAEHQADALLMVTNHDVATLAGWWNQADLHVQAKIGCFANDQEQSNADAVRQHAKAQLLNWLAECDQLPDSWRVESTNQRLNKPFDLSLCEGILCACASGRAELLLLQLDDLQLMESAVNIPGTFREYPNWRRKQAMTTAELFAKPEIPEILRSVNNARSQ